MVFHGQPQHSGSHSLIVNSDSSPQTGRGTQSNENFWIDNEGSKFVQNEGTQLVFFD